MNLAPSLSRFRNNPLLLRQAFQESVERDHLAQPRQALPAFETLLAKPLLQSTANRRCRLVSHEYVLIKAPRPRRLASARSACFVVSPRCSESLTHRHSRTILILYYEISNSSAVLLIVRFTDWSRSTCPLRRTGRALRLGAASSAPTLLPVLGMMKISQLMLRDEPKLPDYLGDIWSSRGTSFSWPA
jgi:hypothetical protein